MSTAPEHVRPNLPIQIFRLASKTSRFMLYDVDAITWLRREHHVLGVLSGTLPQIPQQNIFLGLPLELTPEEARLLLEKEIAYIVRDSDQHHALRDVSEAKDRAAYRKLVRSQASQAFYASETRKEAIKAIATQGEQEESNKVPLDGSKAESSTKTLHAPSESLFEIDDSQKMLHGDLKPGQQRIAKGWTSTPTSTSPLIPTSKASIDAEWPEVKESSFALFKYLHSSGYFLSPGLRFGCQFMAYPGDPLRFHSHFLAVSADWDEEIDLLDVVGEGRLATGVKKGFLLGGLQRQLDGSTATRVFCLEWGGM